MNRVFFTLTAALLVSLATSCGGGGNGADAGTPRTPDAQEQLRVKLRLGYFPNITHAQPLVGIGRGTYTELLGANVDFRTTTFNAGPAAIEALFAGEIDATYIGPNPTINGYVQSDGKELRIVAGATSGGALLVVRPGANISVAGDFDGKTVATPQLGNTQDVALRAWLKSNGLNAREQGGSVRVLPTSNADTLTLFQQGDVDAAWVPEPWATRLVQEADGEIYLDEKDLWPNGRFVTTHLIVRTGFLEDHPDVVKNLIRAHVEATVWIQQNPAEAQELVNANIEAATTKALPTNVIAGAWEHLEITYDPIASSLRKSAADAFELGFLAEEPELSAIYALDLLNEVLREEGLPEVRGG